MVLFTYMILMRLFQLSLPKNVYEIKQKKFSPFGVCALSVIWDSVLNALLQTALDEILLAGNQYFILIGTSLRSCVASK